MWVFLASLLALIHPPIFTWFKGILITIGLGIIMLGMGLTLRLEDFKRVLKRPKAALGGVFLQFTIMPLTGFALGYLFGLPAEYAVGLVLVASCPGGTASNLIAFLAGADVALSVTMTSVSTMLAIAMTPLLTAWLVGSRVDVDAFGLFKSTVTVVLLPVTLGVAMNRWLPRLTEKVLPAAPLAAVVMIVLIVASIIGQGREKILSAAPALLGSVLSLHLLGFSLAWLLGRLLQKEVSVARTLSIEVGMQNSGLGVVLAKSNFANPAVAIPSAISSLVHCLIGSAVAALWRRQTVAKKQSSM